MVHHLLDRLLVGRVELPHVHVDGRVQGVDLALVRVQVRPVEVADIHGPRAVLGEQVRARAADTEDRVGARDDDDFAGDARARGLAGDLLDGGDAFEGLGIATSGRGDLVP